MDGRLHELGQRPYGRPLLVEGLGREDGRKRLVIASEAVVEDSGEELGDRQHESLSPRLRIGDGRLDQLRELLLVTAHRGKRQRTVRNGGDPGRLRGGCQLRLERRRAVKVAPERHDAAAIGQREGQRRHGAGVSHRFELPRREHRPGGVVPEMQGDPAGEPEPPSILCRQHELPLEAAQCLLEQRRSRRVPLGEPDRQPLEEKIRRAR